MISHIVCKRVVIIFSAVLYLLSSDAFAQGFLEMPETSEVPEYERESMLLDLDIPSVRERDPDPDAGPRLNVKEFRLQGVVEFPELGITRKELIKRVEDIRFDLMKEGELTESGYTLDELGEISDLMVDLEKETEGQHVGSLEVQKLVFLIRDQRRRRGVTLGMIETVADTITTYYRERGFILAKAYIPQQKVRDGVVTLTLLLGELGEVKVENRKRVSDSLIQNVFKGDMHKPVTSWDVEESLYLINDVPGLTAQGFFSPGSQVGDTKLSVNVLNEDWYTLNMRIDNHGSKSTSENRAYIDALIHNPLGIGDELYFGVLNSFSPDSSTYGSIRYNTFLFSPRIRSSVGFSTNDFVSRRLTADTTTTFTGESEVADLSLQYIFKRSRVKNISTELKYMNVETILDLNSFLNIEDGKNVSLAFNFDVLNQKRRHLYIGKISAHASEVYSEGGFQEPQTENQYYVNYDLSFLSFPKVPFTDYETRLLVKTSGQYAGERLANMNQVALTGPAKSRAFGVTGAQSDDGLYVGADWIFSLPRTDKLKIFGETLDRVVQPYIFVDAAYGISHPQSVTQEEGKTTTKLSNVGVGLKINHSGFGANIMFASAITDDVNTENIGDREEDTETNSVYFELQYSF